MGPPSLLWGVEELEVATLEPLGLPHLPEEFLGVRVRTLVEVMLDERDVLVPAARVAVGQSERLPTYPSSRST